jgi:hypothetical protein
MSEKVTRSLLKVTRFLIFQSTGTNLKIIPGDSTAM